MLKTDDDSPQVREDKSETFYTLTMKGVFLVKRDRQDLKPGFAYIAPRFRASKKQDCSKLAKISHSC